MYYTDPERRKEQERQAAANGGYINYSSNSSGAPSRAFTPEQLQAIYDMAAKARGETLSEDRDKRNDAIERSNKAKKEAPIKAGITALGNEAGKEAGLGNVGSYAAGAYNLYNAATDKDMPERQRYMQGAQGASQIAAGAGVPYASYVGSAIGAANTLTSDATDQQKAVALRKQGEDLAANYFTAGLWGLAQTADRAFLGGQTDRLRNNLDKSPFGLPMKYGDKLNAKLLSQVGSSKSGDQLVRDKVRDYLKESGFLGDPKADDWNLENPDGTSFDIGKDGGARLDGDRRYFDVDTAKQGQAISSVNPLAYILTGGNEKLATEFAGYFTNTVTQGAGATDPNIANINALDKYKRAGFDTPDKAIAAIVDMEKAGKIDAEKAKAFKQGIQNVFSAKPPAPPQTPVQRAQAPARAAPQKKKNRSQKTYTLNTYAPQTYAPTTTAPLGSPSQYGDAFAQSLANIYANNQGV